MQWLLLAYRKVCESFQALFTPQMQEVNLNDMKLKARSKAEVYRLLTQEAGVYFPPVQLTTHVFLNEILTGSKHVSFLCLTSSISRAKKSK